MSSQPRTILFTGFGPFPGVPANSTSALAPQFAHEARAHFSQHTAYNLVLPTDWRVAPARLTDALETLQPDILIMFGVSDSARGMRLETRAQNKTAQLPDALGKLPGSMIIDPLGPEYLEATAPVQEIAVNLQAVELPIELSSDAGTYLCNAAFYVALAEAARNNHKCLTSFIHLPTALGHTAGGSLNNAQAVKGALIATSTCLQHCP